MTVNLTTRPLTETDLQEITRRIVATAKPVKVILFDLRARGTARPIKIL
jgi:hypothetical protein